MSTGDDDRQIEAQLRGWCDAMIARDVERVMTFCHPDIHLAMHFGDVPLPFVGTTEGAAAARLRTVMVFSAWQFKDPVFTINEIKPPAARTRLQMTVVHRWTGLSTEVKIRQVFKFEDGLIRSFDGYMDAPRFNAFMHYVGLAPREKASR